MIYRVLRIEKKRKNSFNEKSIEELSEMLKVNTTLQVLILTGKDDESLFIYLFIYYFTYHGV